MRFIPHDEKFFDLFTALARRLCEATTALHRLFTEPEFRAQHVAAIKQLEHEADDLTRDVVARIDKSFITPLDREDIHLLASRLDDVIDLLDGAARRAVMFGISGRREPAVRLTEILMRAGNVIEVTVGGMQKPRGIAEHSRQMKRLEEEADAVFGDAIADLFSGAPDALEVIKWKEMYDRLEDAVDQCEDVMNVLESISLKNS